MENKKISWTDYIKTVPRDHREGLTFINEDLSCVQLTPKDDISGYSFENCDLSKMSGMTAEHLREIEFTSGTKLPEKVEGLKFDLVREQWRYHDDCTWPEVTLAPTDTFKGLNLAGSDISRFKGVTFQSLSEATDISECKTPVVTIKSEDDFSKIHLIDLDISHWIGVTAEHINASKDIAGCKLPKMNLATLNMRGKSFSGVDFSLCYNLSWKQCRECSDLTDAKLPYMQIPMDKDKYIEDTPETRKALQEKRQPKKTVDLYMNLDGISITGCDFSKVAGLNEEQVKILTAMGGKNVNLGINTTEKTKLVEHQRAIQQKAMEMAEIIVPMPKDSQKIRYRCPQWLSGPVQSLAWFCTEHKLPHKDIAQKFVGRAPDEILSMISEYKQEYKKSHKSTKSLEEIER